LVFGLTCYHIIKTENSFESLFKHKRNYTIILFRVSVASSSKGAPVSNIVQRAITEKIKPTGSPNAGEIPTSSLPHITFIKIDAVIV